MARTLATRAALAPALESSLVARPRRVASVALLRARLLAVAASLRMPLHSSAAWSALDAVAVLRAVGIVARDSLDAQRRLARTLRRAFPEHAWDSAPSPRPVAPDAAALAHHRAAVFALGEKLGIARAAQGPPATTRYAYAQWYGVVTKDLIAHDARRLLDKFGGSLSRMLRATFPEHAWDVALFRNKPKAFFDKEADQRKFLLSLGEKLGLAAAPLDAWYKVRGRELRSVGGASLLTLYDNSVARVLATLLPEHAWDAARFDFKPHSHWRVQQHQRAFLLALVPGLSSPVAPHALDACYRLKRVDFLKHDGAGLLDLFGGSPRAVIEAAFPEHKWLFWRFASHSRAKFWKEPVLIARVRAHLSDHFPELKPEDWLHLSRKQWRDLELDGLFRSDADVAKFVKIVREKSADTREEAAAGTK